LETAEARIDNSVEAITADLLENLFCMQGKFREVATANDWYLALAYTVRNRMMHRWIRTVQTYFENKSRTVVYLSAEFLIGPQLETNLVNLGMYDQVREATQRLELSLDSLVEQEAEPGLGNGGLGRLAACYMDSLATLQLAAIGYGLRYEFGIFDQAICDGWQVERTDKWLRVGNPWEIPRPEITCEVKLGGHTEHYVDGTGRYCVRWIPDKVILRGTGRYPPAPLDAPRGACYGGPLPRHSARAVHRSPFQWHTEGYPWRLADSSG
jgi:starch phosphorylase